MRLIRISELKPGMNNISLNAKIMEISEPKQIVTKFGTQTTLTIATIEDESGSIKLSLWGKQSEGMEEGRNIEIKGGFVKEFRDEMQLSIGRGGAIKVVE